MPNVAVFPLVDNECSQQRDGLPVAGPVRRQRLGSGGPYRDRVGLRGQGAQPVLGHVVPAKQRNVNAGRDGLWISDAHAPQELSSGEVPVLVDRPAGPSCGQLGQDRQHVPLEGPRHDRAETVVGRLAR